MRLLNNIRKEMNRLMDLDATYLITMVVMLSLNLIFNEEIFAVFKTHFIHRTRAIASAKTHALGSKSKNYHRMSGMNFWKMYDKSKYGIKKKCVRVSGRCRKKLKKCSMCRTD